MIELGSLDSPRRPESSTAAPRVVVALVGELDFAADRALAVLDEAVRAHPGAHVIVDLSDVTFMDSAALVAFAQARARAARGGGAVSLHGASAFAQRMFEIWHLEPGTQSASDRLSTPLSHTR